MTFKVTVVCIAVCLVQTITCQHINIASPSGLTTTKSAQFNNVANHNLLANTASSGQLHTTAANPNLLANTGGVAARPNILTVTSTSPIYPAGLSVYAENIMLEGPLAVTGQVPFLGAIGFEGSLDTAGQGVATCGCGDGNIGIVNEGLTGTRRK